MDGARIYWYVTDEHSTEAEDIRRFSHSVIDFPRTLTFEKAEKRIETLLASDCVVIDMTRDMDRAAALASDIISSREKTDVHLPMLGAVISDTHRKGRRQKEMYDTVSHLQADFIEDKPITLAQLSQSINNIIRKRPGFKGQGAKHKPTEHKGN